MSMPNIQKPQTLYKKEGRKYIPACVTFRYDQDSIKVGTFRLLYAYEKGGGMYSYDVTPDTAGFVAASMIAEKVIEKEIAKARHYEPSTPMPYTKKQLAIIADFREKMEATGALTPPMWTLKTSYEIAKKAIEAVRNYKP